MAASTNFLGGLMLLAFSFAFEPGVWTAASGNWGWPAWAGWFFLLIPGSLGGTIIYFWLVRDWGASRTGTYSFICPVIAVVLGMLVFGERVTVTDTIGIVLMLFAAVLALRR